ncbi:MAG TPA: tripartite tricarboxylate transporter TctB family protein [Alphaproteobacteria bacterium]|jgi:putative tricarboxylic transport membrane protein
MIRIRAPQETAAGLFLIVLAAFVFWQTDDLAVGTMRALGPGMMPRVLASACAVCGLALVILSIVKDGASLERWSIRGPVFILGAAILFGLAIRPLGLFVAGPAAVIIGSLATRDSRFVESVLFGAAMTTFCWLLFKVLLSLPIPVAPWLLGY